jgi:PKD repeat protein
MKHFLHRFKKRVISIFTGAIVLLAFQNQIFAEGTKQVRPDSTICGASLMIDSQNPLFTRFCYIGCPSNYRLYIHIKNVGETILFGLKSPVTNVGYNLKKPNGTIAMTGNLPSGAGAGYIKYYRNAIVGPFPAQSGYTPLSQVITSIADTGNWYFEIKSIPNGADTSYTGCVRFCLFDFQVVSGAHSPAKPSDTINGRVWSQSWQLFAQLPENGFFQPFNASFYAYSDDGITTKFTFNGVHMGEGTIFCNPVGCTNTGNFPVDRQSSNNNTYVLFPGIAWYKVFLNNPDSTVYPNGQYGQLLSDPLLIDNPNYPVCSGKKYIQINVNKKGSVSIKIDVPYGDSTYDVSLSANVLPGINNIPWDGLDGRGNQVPPGTWLYLIVDYINGLTNLPLWDVEENPNGLKVYLIRPISPSLQSPLLYWDDSQLTATGMCPTVPNTVNLTGCESTISACHTWDNTSCHNKMINSWWYSGSSTEAPVLVYYSMTPGAPVPFNKTRCGPGIDTLNVTVVPNTFTADWYNLPVGGTLLLSGSLTFITPYLNSSTTYYAETRDPVSGCLSASRTPVTITVLPLPVIPDSLVSNHELFCSNDTGTITLTAIGGSGTTLHWFSGSCGSTVIGTGSPLVISTPHTTTTYFARWENNCGASACNNVTVNVQTQVIAGTIAADQTICQNGDPASINDVVPGSGTGVITYRWESFSGGGPWVTIAGATGDSYNPPAGLMTTTSYRRIAISTANGYSCESSPTAAVTVTVNIVTSGVVGSNQQICAGANPVSFTELSGATGSGIPGYQWQSNTSGCSGPWTDIPGAISTTYTPPSGLTQTTFFHRVVTFTFNGILCSAVSGCITVTVIPTPLITATPPTQSICSGATTNIALTSNIGTATFAWTAALTSGTVTGFSNGSGSTIAQTLINTTNILATVTYTITPTANGCPGTPIGVVLTVYPHVTATATPAAQSVCSGATTNIGLTSNTGTATFTWTAALTSGTASGFSNGTGSTIAQTLINTTNTVATVTYTITPTANGCQGTPINVIVTVFPVVTVTASPPARSICSNANTNIALTSNIGTATFTWTAALTSGTVTGFSNGTGSTIAQTLINSTNMLATVTYTITPTANGCPGTPIDVVVTVFPAVTATATPASQSICSGATTNIALNSNIGTATFAWTASLTSGTATGFSNGTGSAIAQTLINTTNTLATVTYTVTPTANGCSGTPIGVVVTIYPHVTALATPATQSICSGAITNVVLTSNTGTATFAWTAVLTSGTATGFSNGTGSLIAQTLINTTNTLATVTYTVTPTANGCTGTPINIIVTVFPAVTATATPAAQSVCSGVSTNIALTSNTGTATFAWTAALTSGTATGFSNGTGSTIAQSLINTTNTLATVTYTVTPTANGCPGTPIVAVVTVFPVTTVTASPPSQSICSGTTSNIMLTSNIGTATFAWTATLTSGIANGFSNGTGSTIAQTLINTTNMLATVTYTIIPTANGCPGTPVNVVVTVFPVVTVTASPPARSICSNTNTNIALTSNIGTATFTWTAALTSGTATGFSNGTGSTIAQTLINTTNTLATVTYTITPTANGCPGTPITVVVNVYPAVIVTAAPTTQSICSGATTNIALASNIGTATFSWTAALTSGTATGFSNGTGSTIAQTLINTTNTLATVTYSVTPTANGCAGTPINVVVTVFPVTTVTASPPSQSICPGTTTNIVLTSNIGTAAFSWTASLTSGTATGFSNGSGSTIVQTLINTTNTLATVTYTITPTANGCPGTPIDVVVTVNPIVNVTATPAAQSICSDATTNIALTSNIGTATFAWTAVLTTGTATGFSNGTGPIIVQTLINTTNTLATVTYTVMPTAYGCSGTPITVVLTVFPSVTATAAPNTQSICSGANTNVVLTSNTGTATFAWTAVLTSGIATGFSNGTGSTIAQTLINTTNTLATVTYTVIPTANGCPGTPINAVVTVFPVATVTATPDVQSICSGTITNIILTSNIGSATFAWTAALTSGTANGFSNGTGSTIAQTLINTTNTLATVTYTITPTANGCAGTPIEVLVTVFPVVTSTATPSAPSVCSGATTHIVLTSNTGTATFSWTAALTSGTASGFSNGTGSPIAQTLINTTNTQAIVTYTITPTANGCQGVPMTVEVTVNPLPVPSINGPSIACTNSTGNVYSTESGMTNYNWTITGGTISAGAGTNSVTVTWNSPGTQSIRVTYTNINGCNPVASSILTVNISSIVASVTGSNATCYGASDGSASVNVSGGIPEYTYLWNDPQAQTTDTAINLSPGTYSVVISDAALCSTSKCVTILQEYPTPSAFLSMTSGEKICKGDSVTLQFALTGTPPWSLSYTNGTNTTTVTGITSSPFIVKVYPIDSCVYTITGLTDAHCTAVPGMLQGSAQVNVFPLPAVEYTWQYGGQNDAIQFHIDSTITNLPAIGYMVLWNFGDGTFGYGHNPDHIYPGSMTYNCMLTVTDTNGCVNSVAHIINVTETPHAFFSATSPACKGQPICFTDLSYVQESPGYIKTWIWNFGDGTAADTIHFPNNPDVCHLYTALGTYPVTLTIIDNNDYTDSYTEDVVIIPNPIAGFSHSEACQNQVVQFEDNSSVNGSVDIISWLWNFGDPGSGVNNTSQLRNPIHIYNGGGQFYAVSLSITNFNNCQDTALNPVWVRSSPPVDFTRDTACNGQVVHYTADTIITHIDSIVTWLWDFGDGSQPVTNPVTATHTYTSPGTYITTLTVTDHHGCANSVPHGVKVNPLPIAQFSWSSPACLGSAVQYTDNSTVPSGYTGYIAKWLWDFGDGTSQLVELPASPNVTHSFVGQSMTHTVRLTVWTSDSCSQFIEHVIESIPSPSADFSYSTVQCKDQPVQFTDLSGTNGGVSIAQWSWNFDDPGSGINNTSNLQNPSHTYLNSGTYHVSLIVTNYSGCSDTIIKVININVLPVADFHVDTACLNNSSQFTDLTTSNGGIIINYSWDFGDGSAISHLQNPTHTYAISGTFNVKLTVVNSNGCQKDTTKPVLVNPSPIAAFSYSTPNCLGTIVQYTDLSTTPPGYPGSIVEWVWDFGDGTSMTIFAPANPNVSHTFTGTALSHVVRLTVTISDGCTSYTEHTINSIPSPVANFGFPATNCSTYSVQFTDLSQSNGGGSIISWQWNFGDPVSGVNNSSILQNPVHLFTDTGNFTVTLIIFNASSCSDTVLKTIRISPAPVANFTADTVCLHQATQFTDISIPNAPGIIAYSWDFGDGSLLSGVKNPSHTYSSYGLMNVKLTVTNNNGCTKDTTKQILVNPVPSAEFSFSTVNCHGSPVQFTDHSTVVPGYLVSIIQWVWNFGDGTPAVTIVAPANPNITHVFAGTGSTYTVRLTVTTSNGCSSFIEHSVNVMASPLASFTYPTSNCVQQTVQFTDNSQTNGGGNIIQWLWNFGDPLSGLNNISALQNPYHFFNAAGTYIVTEIIYNTSDCSDTVTHTITVSPLPVADFVADTACLGSPTTFIDQSSITSGQIIQYLWDFGDGTTSNLKDPVHSYLADGIHQVTLTVTTQAGCRNTITKSVFVLPMPIVTFSASGPTCLGSVVQFTDDSYAMYGSIHSWTWNFGDGSVIAIISPASPNVSHLYMASGTYNVTLSVVTSNNCITTTMNPVTVQPAPVAKYTFSSLRCELSPVQFTNISQNNGGTPITQWLWDFNDPGSGIANNSTLPNPVHSFTTSGNYNVKLTVTSADGCIDSISSPVPINARPIAQFLSDTACAHSPTQFIDQSIANAPGIISWHWNFGDPASGTHNTSQLQNPSHIYSNSGNYLVTFTVINTNLCERDTLILIPIPPTPVAMFTSTSSCAKTPTQFTDLSIAPNSQLESWFWDFGDGIGTSTVQNPVYTYTTSGTYNVKLRVTNISGCADSITIPVISNPLPVAAFTYNNFFCPAGQVTFTDQSHGIGSGIAERLWIFEPGSNSTLADPTFIFPVTDTTYLVTLIVTDTRGCKDTTTDSVFVKPAFSFTFNHDTVCFGNPTHFHAQDNTPGDSLYSLRWNFGDPASGVNNTSTQFNPKHVFSSPGTFVVRLKAWDSDYCTDSVYRTTIVHALPKPGYSFVSPPCDSLTSFTDLSDPGSGMLSSWTWNFGDGSPDQIITAPGPGNTTHVFDIPGNYRVGLKVNNSFGCSDTLSRLIKRPSCISAGFIQSIPGACTKASVTFTDNSQPVNQISDWHWIFGDGTDTVYTRYSIQIRHTFINSGTYSIRLIISAIVSQQTFTDTAMSMVTINQAPEAQFSADPVCLNKITLFKDQSNTFGVDITSRRWSFGDPSSGNNNFSDLPDPSHQYQRTGSYNISLLVINKSGCEDSLTKSTRVFTLPAARFTSTLACRNNPTNFLDRSIVIDTTIERWHWTFGVPGMKKDTSMLRNPFYEYKKEGSYDVGLIVKDYHGCYDTIDSTITVHPSPLSAFLLIDSISDVPGRIQLRNKSEGADSYFWEFGNGYTSTEENPIVTYKEDGTYTIMLVSANNFGCTDSTFLKYEMLFKGLYVPNAFVPARDIQGVNVFKPVGINLKEYKIQVFDPWGELIWESSLLDGQGRPVESWNGMKSNGDYYQSGTYVWKINAVFIDGTNWEGSDIGKGKSGTIGTVTLIR